MKSCCCWLHPSPAQELYTSQAPASITRQVLWARLEPLLWYLPSDEQRRLVRAGLDAAVTAHEGQFRKSGEPFVTHPVEVARILAEMRLDHESIIAGALLGCPLGEGGGG